MRRIVLGLAGRVEVRSELDLRFDYGSLRPALEVGQDRAVAFVGPDLVVLHSPAKLSRQGSCIVGEVEVREGEQDGRQHLRRPHGKPGVRECRKQTGVRGELRGDCDDESAP